MAYRAPRPTAILMMSSIHMGLCQDIRKALSHPEEKHLACYQEVSKRHSCMITMISALDCTGFKLLKNVSSY